MTPDELAKERARRPARVGTPMAGGAAALDQRIQSQRNADMAAKNAALRPSDMKMTARPKASAGIRSVPSTDTTVSGSSSVEESDAQVKQRIRAERQQAMANHGTPKKAPPPAAVSSSPTTKEAAPKKASSTGGSSTNRLSFRPPPKQMTAEEARVWEERIAYKTGIPLNDDPPAGDNATRPSSLSEEYGEKEIELKDIKLDAVEKDALQQPKEFTVSRKDVLDKNGAIAPSKDSAAAEKKGEKFQGTFCEPPSDLDKLAVARAVQDGDEEDPDEDAFLPSAIEYDPDAKPPLLKNRRFRLYGGLACVLGLALIAGLVAFFVSGSDEPKVIVQADGSENGPSPPPSTSREGLGIQSQLELVVGKEQLEDPTSHYFLAMDWLLHEDPMQLVPSSPNLIQRYLMALFHLQTSEENGWLSCAYDETAAQESDCIYKRLVAVRPLQYLDVPWSKWMSGIHECSWAGVVCDDRNQTASISLCKYICYLI